MTAINPQVLRWFERERKIDPELVIRFEIYSGSRTGIGAEVVPDPEGRVICFPTYRDGQVIAEKYRAEGKTFWQKPGGIKTFYNDQILDDPLLQKGQEALIITEGEVDLLSAVQSGFVFTVSVPDGAPPANYQSRQDDEHDQKFSYIVTNWDRLKPIKKIILAVDNDAPGKILAEELVRRLGRVRCYWVSYPDGCKDLNDVLRAHGEDGVREVLTQAKPYPVNGLYRLSDYPAEPALVPLTTGWSRLDEYLMVFYPAFMVVTGFAGSGKSTWTNQLVAQLAARHQWRAAIASFEMRLEPWVTDTLRAVFLDKPRSEWTEDDIKSSNEWIEDNFVFITPAGDEEASPDISWLIERAAAAVIRHGIRVLVIDPWNEIEHSRERHENLTEYTGRAIRALKKFGTDFDCLVIVVAHPTKSAASKPPAEVSLYDISDTAHFANKADLGIVIAREPGVENYLTHALVRKVRFQPDTGKPGDVILTYDPRTRSFAQ